MKRCVWVVILVGLYGLCLIVAFLLYRPETDIVHMYVAIASAFMVCVLAPLLEYVLGTRHISPRFIHDHLERACEGLIADELSAPLLMSLPYYTAYLLCALHWAHPWVAATGIGLGAVLIMRVLRKCLFVRRLVE